jgi:hypothetical protein
MLTQVVNSDAVAELNHTTGDWYKRKISRGFTLRKADVRCQRLEASEGCALAREYS